MRAAGYVWASGQSVLSLLAALLLVALGQLRFAGVEDGVLQYTVRPGTLVDRRRGRFNGFSGGWVVVFTEESIRWSWVRGHEIDGHTFSQHFVLGPLLPIAYCLAGLFALSAGGRFYRDNIFEILAGRAGNARSTAA
ncbi:MAG TPA: hypothetical protein VD948_02870 [Rhodothermales bacterium]|nr:hypothetical protein [Rhodothermales bacterium]